jgi:hypothetical protein
MSTRLPGRDGRLDRGAEALPSTVPSSAALRYYDLAHELRGDHSHAGTTRTIVTQVAEFAIEIGMLPIPVRQGHNGYVVNS